ncbi:MAG: helix-turn-helix domain-containing protein [Microcoleaceae cyanobacterium MO_207.B10]|nr:helix-turn-helix domain-containing protein [Microcoleaceae cyanobacterium MO_207.B10]
MLLGFKTELYPTNQQKTLLAKHALCSPSRLELGFMAD